MSLISMNVTLGCEEFEAYRYSKTECRWIEDVIWLVFGGLVVQGR